MTVRAAVAALAVALTAAPAAHASTTAYGPAMSTAQVRSLQAQGVREIIVERRPGVTGAVQARLRAQAGVAYVGPGPLPGTEVDRAPAGQLAAAVASLERDPQVQYAEPNGEVHSTSAPNDPYFADQWGLENAGQALDGIPGSAGTSGDDIGATYAWPHSTGAGVTVAVVDTGVDSTAPDLQGQLVAGYDFINSTTTAEDQNGHGTHVAGIIAAAQNNGVGVSGVAPGAQVMPLRVLDASGSGTFDDVAAAFNYAGDHGVPIVNASLGGSAPSQTLEQAIATHPNTLYVVAAGNDGTNDDTTPFYPCDVPEPNLICVGATDQNDQPASFSNYGAGNVDLFAPGVDILSTWMADSFGNPQYYYASGTSMATPMVSGTLALMVARNSSLTAAQLRSDLLTSVDPEPQLSAESASGGELDAAAAVATAGGDAPYAAPGNTGRPQVSGASTVGSTLTTSPGTWSREPTAISYQWERCSFGACAPVAGATGASYTPSATDLGASFYVVVSAMNASGSTHAISSQTSAVQPAAAPAPVSGGSGPGSGPASATHSTVRLSHVAVVDRRSVRALVFTLSSRARVQIRLSAAARTHAPRSRAGVDVSRITVTGRRGINRYTLSSLLRGHHLARGHYTLTVHAGGRTVTVHLTVS